MYLFGYFYAVTSVFDSNEGISSQVLPSDSGSICQGWPSPPPLSRRNTEIASPSRQNSSLTKKRYSIFV